MPHKHMMCAWFMHALLLLFFLTLVSSMRLSHFLFQTTLFPSLLSVKENHFVSTFCQHKLYLTSSLLVFLNSLSLFVTHMFHNLLNLCG